MKKKASNRNRHTGRINAYKAAILEQGSLLKIGSTEYRAVESRKFGPVWPAGYTAVRV